MTNNEKEIKKINCALFSSKNEIMTRITAAINDAQDVKKKAVFAKELIRQAEGLLSCKYFNKEKRSCEICQTITKARKLTAELIIRAGELK